MWRALWRGNVFPPEGAKVFGCTRPSVRTGRRGVRALSAGTRPGRGFLTAPGLVWPQRGAAVCGGCSDFPAGMAPGGWGGVSLRSGRRVSSVLPPRVPAFSDDVARVVAGERVSVLRRRLARSWPAVDFRGPWFFNSSRNKTREKGQAARIVMLCRQGMAMSATLPAGFSDPAVCCFMLMIMLPHAGRRRSAAGQGERR